MKQQCVAVCCSVLQCVAVCSGVVIGSKSRSELTLYLLLLRQLNTLQHTATHCNTLQHTATHCNTLQHTTTHYNTLQHTATHSSTPWLALSRGAPEGLACSEATLDTTCDGAREAVWLLASAPGSTTWTGDHARLLVADDISMRSCGAAEAQSVVSCTLPSLNTVDLLRTIIYAYISLDIWLHLYMHSALSHLAIHYIYYILYLLHLTFTTSYIYYIL